MNTKFYLLLPFLFLIKSVSSQEIKNEPKFGISLSGFVKADLLYDSRQTENLREAMVLLYPLNSLYDKNGNDINAKSSFNQSAITSRLIGVITGPDAFKAKTSALIEADFTGQSNSNNNGFRLRHAYLKLNWKKSLLLIGQYWHPLDVIETAPNVLALNTGAPFRSFNRSPQIRFEKYFGKLSIIAAAVSQRDYTNDGPIGASSDYIRNSSIPNFNLQFQFKSNENIFGLGADYKQLTPRLITDSLIKANETIDSYSAIAFAKFTLPFLTIKAQSILGQNLYDHTMMGGYAVEKIDTLTGKRTYTTLNQLTAFIDMQTKGATFKAGLFLGYAKNLGSLKNIRGAYYSRGKDIEYAYRIAPRLMWFSGKICIASEFEYTVAAYGDKNSLGEVSNSKEIGNTRINLGAIFSF
ncbi:MAG: hypothetical protein HXX09_12320 [Bacteroidetes bacterium]|nr:hypothetical protein [Bacteroidota bacterium]